MLALTSSKGLAQPISLKFEHIINQDQMPIGETNAVFQDHMGFIWFGGSNGLARYDGISFVHFSHDPNDPRSINNNFIWDIIEDSQKRMWIATPHGLNQFHRETNSFTQHRNHHDDARSPSINDVYKIFEDHQHKLWLGTRDGLDLFDPATEDFVRFRHDPQDKRSIDDNIVLSIYEDHKQQLWIGTQRGGLNLFDRDTNAFSRFYPENLASSDSSSIRDILGDGNSNLWLATDRGLYKFLPGTKVFNFFGSGSERENRLWSLLLDNNNNLWIATDDAGLSIYYPDTNQFANFKEDPLNPFSIGSNNIREIFQDNSNNYWVALFPFGVDFVNSRSTAFKTYQNIPGKDDTLRSNVIDYVHASLDHKVWVGTERGASLFDPKTQSFEHFYHQPENPQSLSANAVLAIEIDQQGKQWFGTWSGGLNIFDPQTKTFAKYQTYRDKKQAIPGDYIWSLLADSKNNLWIGYENRGLDKLDLNTHEITNYFPEDRDNHAISHRFVRCIAEDREGHIWAGTPFGLNRLDPESGKFTRYFYNRGKKNSIPHNNILSLHIDADGTLWVGSELGLSRYNPRSDGFTNFGENFTALSTAISSIQTDRSGLLWLSTLDGVIHFNPSNEAIKFFSKDNGLAGNLHNRNASYLSPEGELYLGSTQGLTVFTPEQIQADDADLAVYLTDLKIFNKSVKVGAGSPLSKDISLSEQIELDHKQSMITFEFAALNYVNPHRNRYQYTLNGFDDKWIDAGNQRSATYTNLNPGKYEFRVRGANEDDVGNDRETSIAIIINPPLWMTPLAFGLYLTAFALLVYLFIIRQRRRFLSEQQKVERLRSLDRIKDEFIANISHELRTPLNGIIGLTESLIDEHFEEYSKENRNHLKMIASSSRRLSGLINDILDFSKIRIQGLRLTKRKVDVNTICRSIITMMSPLAEKKDLKLLSDIPPNLPFVQADEDRLQQILYNLIGNAIKFTSDGHVKVSALSSGPFLKISIEDTGISIPNDQADKIFDSFTQASSDASREFEGSGLGLTIAKNLIELHGGEISVDPYTSAGQGKTFSFTLPIANESTLPVAEDHGTSINKVIDIDQESVNEELVTSSPNLDTSQFHVLVVDDDPVNRQVLVSQLALHEYRISEAADGFKALELIKTDKSIDLVLLDIMMPKITGYETATRIRMSRSVHELPIIFVTAKHLASDLVRGFVSGGNDFIIKPVSKNELLSRVKTHLQLLNITRNLESLVEERTNTLRQAHQELERLDNIVNQINREDSLEGLTNVLLEQTLSLLESSEYAAFFLKSDSSQTFRLISAAGEALTVCRFDEQVTESELIRPILNLSNSPEIEVLAVDPEQLPIFERCKTKPKHILVLPIRIDSEISGLIVLAGKESDNRFSENDINNLKKLRSHAVSAVSKAKILEQLKAQNTQLELASYTDHLTGLLNRRHLIKNIEPDIAICLRSYHQKNPGGYPEEANLLFMLIDIDHFKSINDSYGHATGDKIIKQFSQRLRKVFRESDYLIRWGGEEFLVVVRFCKREEASHLAERFRKVVASEAFELDDGPSIRKTCSIGYSVFPFYQDAPMSYSWEQVVDLADKCLYVAKNNARDAWVGVSGQPGGDEPLSFAEISEDFEACVGNRSIQLQHSIAAPRKIIWRKIHENE
ncbi:MAG: diguanylate cyclase [Cellvibrionaceae bacterium]|nr:diguanylate cyclase [Cellvibrionaceae bacterium]